MSWSMQSNTKRFLRKPEILKITGVTPNTLWVWTNEGTFPKPYKLSSRTVGWADNEVEEWISKTMEGKNP